MKTTHEAEAPRPDRRGFLGALIAAGVAGVAWIGGAIGRVPSIARRRERPIGDADLYGPHDLAG